MQLFEPRPPHGRGHHDGQQILVRQRGEQRRHITGLRHETRLRTGCDPRRIWIPANSVPDMTGVGVWADYSPAALDVSASTPRAQSAMTPVQPGIMIRSLWPAPG
ncbi:hypothetical protein GCM10027089_13210 [Nocardia thraciensis]